MLIMGNVKYAVNKTPLAQLDSLHYCSLRDQVGFNEFFCNTYCADGRWFWHERNQFDGVYRPLIFKKE